MRAPRFLISDPLAVGQTIELPPACCHHALRVLRLRPGDALVLFDGMGSEFEAFLVPHAHSKSRWQATIARGGPIDREARLRITVVQALCAQEKIDWFLEKAVELGAGRIVFASAARSLVRLNAARRQRRIERWRELVAAASSQCGRNVLALVEIADDLAAALAGAQGSNSRWLLDPSAPHGLTRANGGSVTLVVGPEGGFTAEETSLAHSLGYVGARLGPRVLRTETAALAGISALLALEGEFS